MIDPEKIAVIFLAAGESHRFGQANKLLATLDGRPVVSHASELIASCGFGAMVAVCSDDRVASLAARSGFTVVRNDAPSDGLSHSLALGIDAVPSTSEAALVCLADMPWVTAAHLRTLLAAFDPPTTPIIASDRAGRAMPPALFDRSCFKELRRQTGDRGARDLLTAAARVSAGARILADIDSPPDLTSDL